MHRGGDLAVLGSLGSRYFLTASNISIAIAGAIPGLTVAALIFLLARMATQVSSAFLERVSQGETHLGWLDADTAMPTRRLFNVVIWLFALAMAYPYLPGAQTEAFKGLSVILGIMVSIGASGLVGQVASGVILVYTRALSLGEYVRIQECEGTVTEIGLFVTRLRTGMGVEVALPNSLVLGNVTHNFSRQTADGGCVLAARLTEDPGTSVLLVEAGGTVIAQDEKSSVVWGMPGAVAQAGYAEAVKPLKDLSQLALRMMMGEAA